MATSKSVGFHGVGGWSGKPVVSGVPVASKRKLNPSQYLRSAPMTENDGWPGTNAAGAAAGGAAGAAVRAAGATGSAQARATSAASVAASGTASGTASRAAS